MKYRIKIAGYCDFWLYTSEFEQLGEAIRRHIAHGFRDGSTNWHGVQITECADGSEIAKPLKCISCGVDTEYCCADCMIDKKQEIYVCGRTECRDKHERRGCTRIGI